MNAEQLRDAYRQFSRNFRWGTCADCPVTSNGDVYPEFCVNTKRYDHNLTSEELAKQSRLTRGTLVE